MTPAGEYEQRQRRLLALIRAGRYGDSECAAIMVECAALWERMTADERAAFESRFKVEQELTGEQRDTPVPDPEKLNWNPADATP